MSCAPPNQIAPDPDIGGIGVLISFSVSATLTLAASVAKEVQRRRVSVRPADFLRHSWLDDFILGLSDQQLFTGIAILLIGFSKFNSITTYHFNLVLHLSMFSCASHIASVIALRDFFRHYQAARAIRAALMFLFALALLIGVALPMEGMAIKGSTFNLGLPLRCSVAQGKFPYIQFVLVVIALVTGYGSAFCYVFPMALGVLRREPPSPRSKKFHLYFSAFACGTWWIIALSFWIEIKLRADAANLIVESENVWSFGQILAVLLIVIPVFNAVESLLVPKESKVARFSRQDHPLSVSSTEALVRLTSDGKNWSAETRRGPVD